MNFEYNILRTREKKQENSLFDLSQLKFDWNPYKLKLEVENDKEKQRLAR